jgi:uncharacterized FlaG/YvyC family protein
MQHLINTNLPLNDLSIQHTFNTPTSLMKEVRENKSKPTESNKSENEPRNGSKAFFALNKDKQVVIKFVDDKGKTVMQIPSEEYLVMSKVLKENMDSLYNQKV